MKNDEVGIELAIGLGEGFSFNTEGSPYYLTFNKTTKKVEIKEFGNYSFETQADDTSSKPVNVRIGSTKRSRIDYQDSRYLIDEEELLKIGVDIGEIALTVHEYYKQPQCVKGLLYKNDIYLINTNNI